MGSLNMHVEPFAPLDLSQTSSPRSSSSCSAEMPSRMEEVDPSAYLTKPMPPLQRMIPPYSAYQIDEEIVVQEMLQGQRYPQFLEGRYNMKKKGKWILARGKTSTLRISNEPRNGTFAIGVVHGSPDYFTDKITQLQHKTPKGIHPKKKDFTRGDEPVFSIWTDRTSKDSATFMDLSVGKYKTIKMAIVHLANERDLYLNFNTESTALCLESLGQLWNLVVLELRETETNYEAGFQDLDRMEDNKIPIKVVSVLRRNAGNTAGSEASKSAENPFLSEITKHLADMPQSELIEVYQQIMLIKSKRHIQPMDL